MGCFCFEQYNKNMNKDKLLQFLLEARTKTYAGDRGEN